MSLSILIVDDDEPLRTRLSRAFSDRGFRTFVAADTVDAETVLRTERPDRAVFDLRMPGASGLRLLERVAEIPPDTAVVMLSGYGSIAAAVDAVRLGAVNFVQKPADVEDLLAAFERADAPPLNPPEAQYVAPTLARAEWEHINRVLADCGGNISRAARQLGLHRRTLQRKLQTRPPKD